MSKEIPPKGTKAVNKLAGLIFGGVLFPAILGLLIPLLTAQTKVWYKYDLQRFNTTSYTWVNVALYTAYGVTLAASIIILGIKGSKWVAVRGTVLGLAVLAVGAAALYSVLWPTVALREETILVQVVTGATVYIVILLWILLRHDSEHHGEEESVVPKVAEEVTVEEIG